MARKNKKSFPDLLNRRTFLISSALLTAQSATAAPEAEEHPSGNEVIWFRYPGGDWNTQALHLGNAYFGASLIGDVKQ